MVAQFKIRNFFSLFSQKYLSLTLILFGFLCLFPDKAYAQFNCTVSDPPALSELACPITTGINYLLGAVGFAFIIITLYGSIKYSLSEGDSKAIEAAKKSLTWGLIGFVAVLGAVSLINILIRIFIGGSSVAGLEETLQSISDFLDLHGDPFTQ